MSLFTTKSPPGHQPYRAFWLSVGCQQTVCRVVCTRIVISQVVGVSPQLPTPKTPWPSTLQVVLAFCGLSTNCVPSGLYTHHHLSGSRCLSPTPSPKSPHGHQPYREFWLSVGCQQTVCRVVCTRRVISQEVDISPQLPPPNHPMGINLTGSSGFLWAVNKLCAQWSLDASSSLR